MKILTDAQAAHIRGALDDASQAIDKLSRALYRAQCALKEQLQENYILLTQLHQIDLERMRKK